MCTEAEKEGKFAYELFSREDVGPESIVQKFFTEGGGGQCFFYCNRYALFNVHHKTFVRDFLFNFGPAAPDPSVDQRAITLLAAFLNIRQPFKFKSRTFLSLLIRNIKNPDEFCYHNQRCVTIINGFRAYQQALKSGQVIHKTLQINPSNVASTTQNGAK